VQFADVFAKDADHASVGMLRYDDGSVNKDGFSGTEQPTTPNTRRVSVEIEIVGTIKFPPQRIQQPRILITTSSASGDARLGFLSNYHG